MGYEGREDIFFIIYGLLYFYILYICVYICIYGLYVNIKKIFCKFLSWVEFLCSLICFVWNVIWKDIFLNFEVWLFNFINNFV